MQVQQWLEGYGMDLPVYCFYMSHHGQEYRAWYHQQKQTQAGADMPPQPDQVLAAPASAADDSVTGTGLTAADPAAADSAVQCLCHQPACS